MPDATKNKIKYGISKLYYAVATIDDTNNTATYSTPVAWPGAVSLSLDAEGDTSNFYADNIVYYTSVANNGYTGDLETALVPESFRKDVLGELEDANGVLVEKANVEPVHFALLFQFEGDQRATKHVLYNCVATRPTTEGSTKEDTIEPQTETVSITALPIHNATLNADIVKARTATETDSTADAGWYSAVYVPSTTIVTS